MYVFEPYNISCELGNDDDHLFAFVYQRGNIFFRSNKNIRITMP